ncbi:hypothetical protein CDV31_002813 [Fusarium ambrosium]|uniref:DUF7908 domain-containing protein n=1 Tax=Fusarium ambrosium TaxID=131363 RepID=A0A428UVI7_9HYPO|nr:hypothetical protein CDV31_002813 [Fusarium ambrosium]
MKHQFTAFAAFGGFINAASAIEHAELVSGSWCVTYLSTYLAPIGTADAAPNSTALDSLAPDLSSPTLSVESEFLPPSDVATTAGRQPTGSGQSSIASDVAVSDRSSSPSILASDLPSVASDTPSSETSTGPGLSGQQVIFLITPSGDISKRELRGFVGNSNPQVCTFASIFTLGTGPASGQLFDGNVPLYYQGEDYQAFQALGSPPDGAITRTFANEGGTLQFKNPSLPNGQATFCQESSSGLVYMVFTSGPPNCTPVQLSVYGVEKCVDGRLIGLDESSTASSQATKSVSIDEEEKTGTSTHPLTLDTSLTADTSSMTEAASTAKSNDPLSDTTEPAESASEQSTVAESSGVSSPITSAEPSPSSPAEVSSLDSTALPVTEATTASSSTDELSSTLIKSSTPGESQSSTESSPSSEPTSAETDTESTKPTESLESSDTLVSTEPPTSSESPTTSDVPTTIIEEPFVITNSFPGGRFSDGLGDLEISGDVTHQIGGCYKDDGSPDDGCAAMRANGGGTQRPTVDKRALDTFAGMSMWLDYLRPSTKVLYTVQFYYAIVAYGGGINLCTVDAWLGNRHFYFNDYVVMGNSVQWIRVLTTVIADSQRANFGIWIDCWDFGFAEIYVDSIFISNQVTPQNIDRFQLNFEDSPNNPTASSTRRSSSSTSRSSSRSPSTPSAFSTPGASTKRSSSNVNSLTIESQHTPLYTPTASWNTPTYSGRTHNSSSSLGHSPSTPGNWHTPTSNHPSPTTGQPPRTPIASQPVCPDGWRYPGHCGQAWPTPTKPICEKRGRPEARYYQYTLEEKPLQDLDIQRCAITCAYMDDCFSFSVNPDDPNKPCYFLKQRLGEVPFPEPTPGLEGNLIWSDLECFNCFLCGEMPSSSTWLPNPILSTKGGHSTPGPVRDSTTLDNGENSTPTPSRRPTATSEAPAESSSSDCKYVNGEECEMDRWTNHGTLLCGVGAVYNGDTWTEHRNDYPHQDNYQQCAAICQTLENCRSAGYYEVGNHCYFTSAILTPGDMTYFDEEPWKQSIWSDNSCWICPPCVPQDLNRPSRLCSYTSGEVCTRRDQPPDGPVCNLPAYLSSMYRTGHELDDFYPLQRSSEECAAICVSMVDCKGSGYKDGHCLFFGFLLSTDPSDPIPLQTDNPALFNGVWDDPLCFDCPGCYHAF